MATKTHRIIWHKKLKKYVVKIKKDDNSATLFDGTKSECDDQVLRLNQAVELSNSKKKRDD